MPTCCSFYLSNTERRIRKSPYRLHKAKTRPTRRCSRAVAVATTFLALICIVGITTTNRDGSKAAMYTVWAFSALSRGATRCRIVAPRQRQERLLQSPSPFALLSTISTATTEVETTPKRSSMSTKDAVTLKHMDYATTTLSSSAQSHKPAAIFLHGLLGNKRNFCSIGTSLSQQMQTPRRLIGLDLRNHGENHHDWRDDMSYTSMALDVLHFCDVHGLDRIELIGHSVGGKVAQAVALLQPDRIAGLVVIDIAPVRYTPDEPHWQAVSDIIDVLSSVVTVVPENAQKALSKRDVDAQLRPLIPDPALRAFCLTNFGANGQWTVPLSHIRNQLDTLAGFDVSTTTTTTTQQFAGDAFFIHGGQSKFVRHSHLDAISTYFPNHMLTTIRGAGHWVHAEAPEDTTALLQRFLDR